MARTVYEDKWVTEYDDGTIEVRFSDAEWEQMLSDPAFGYVCQALTHRMPEHGDGTCWACEAESAAADDYHDITSSDRKE